METVIVNAIIGFWLLLFGAMAVVPFLLEGKPVHQTPVEDDQIISIQPVAPSGTPRRPLTPLSISTPDTDRREAA